MHFLDVGRLRKFEHVRKNYGTHELAPVNLPRLPFDTNHDVPVGKPKLGLLN
jgi:hypothetical protein